MIVPDITVTADLPPIHTLLSPRLARLLLRLLVAAEQDETEEAAA